MIEKYGMEFPASWSELQCEFWCMLQNHKTSGGLGMDGHLRNAMMMMWPQVYGGEMEPGVPRWRDELELLTWAFCKYRVTAVIGHASAGKTHTFGHIMAACYTADATRSIITLTSTHLNGLRKRLWADTVMACHSSTLGHIYDVRAHDMVIRPRGFKDDKYVIEGIATDRGQDAVEKIQGTHSINHRYVVVDEAQGTPKAIFDATANLMTDPDFRVAYLANPNDRYSELGSWCEPRLGWDKIDPEIDLWWETKRGGVCVRLDGMKSANIKRGRTIFPFLLRQDYVDSVVTAFGIDSPRYWTYVRGWFAPDGSSGIIYPSGVLAKASDRINFDFQPKICAALDPAFEGGDNCQIVFAEYGNAKGSPFAFNVNESTAIKVKVSSESDPLDYLIAHEAIRLCKEKGVAPEDFILDVTGAGRGVAAIMAKEWSPLINRCSFGGAATDRTLKSGEPEPAKDLFDRFVSELWWSGRAFMEEGLVGGVDETFPGLRKQLSARMYESVKDKKISIEPKKEMRARVGYSPDEGDAFCMVVELLRRKGAVAGTQAEFKGGHPDQRHLDRAVRYSEITNADNEFSYGSDS